MNGRSEIPNFHPDYCLKVAKRTVAFCVGILALELLILIGADASTGRCPGWLIYDKNEHTTSLWGVVGLMTAAPTAWVCLVVFRWKSFSQKMYDSIVGDYTPFPNVFTANFRKRFKPDPRNLNTDTLFVGLSIMWCLFCTIPLWIMAVNCISF